MKIPVLCVHDSFLIGYSNARRLKLAMKLASQAETGVSIKMSHNFMGLDEVEQRNPALVDDYLEIRHRAPCDEYRIRERLFQERVAYLQDQGIEG
jgi:dsDNA-specific endonuclease/ATPase MutS2